MQVAALYYQLIFIKDTQGCPQTSKIGCTCTVWREPESSLDPIMTKHYF